MLCGALGVLAHVARDRLPPNNFAERPDFDEGRIQDRATSPTSRKIVRAKPKQFATPDPACFCRSRRRARRDVRLRASSPGWTPPPKTSSHPVAYRKASPDVKISPATLSHSHP